MSIFHDPQKADKVIGISLILFLAGGLMSATRIQMFAESTNANTIASTRVSECRVLPPNEAVVLGGVYYDPPTSTWLTEGTFICDLYGRSARIDRYGNALFVVTTDPTSMNKELEKRLKEPTNPDSIETNRVRRDISRGVIVPQEPQVQEAGVSLFGSQQGQGAPNYP